MRSRLSGIASFCALLVPALVIYGPLFTTRPFEGDILYILSWADTVQPADLLRVDPLAYPEWRPLAYGTVWLQYRWATIDYLWTYYLVNVLLWTTCGWLVYRIVHVLSGSAPAGFVAAAIVLTSTQPISTLVLIEERQSSLACLFGLAACLVVTSAGSSRFTRFEWVSVSLLLLASALSKEYGLAFTGALAVYALYDRLWPLAAAAITAGGTYAGLRIGFAGGATAPFCEEQGYFLAARHVCFDRFDVPAITQAAYNIVATGLGSLLPGLFSDDGQISISPRWLMTSAILLALALLGWAKGRRPVRIGVLVVCFNTLLSFLLYRSRNHVAAICAVAVATGVGLPIAAVALRKFTPSPLVRAMAIVTLVSILSMRAIVTRRLIADRVERSSHPDVCGPDSPDLDRAFVRRVWRKYNMPLPECLTSRTGASRANRMIEEV